MMKKANKTDTEEATGFIGSILAHICLCIISPFTVCMLLSKRHALLPWTTCITQPAPRHMTPNLNSGKKMQISEIAGTRSES